MTPLRDWNGWLPPEMAGTLSDLVGLRNILVHGYQAVYPRIVPNVAETRFDDMLAFVAAIRRRLPGAGA